MPGVLGTFGVRDSLRQTTAESIDSLPERTRYVRHCAHSLIIQILLLAGCEPSAVGAGGSSVWERAEVCGDATALGLLTEWDIGMVECTF